MTLRRLALALGAVLAVALLFPDPLLAWTPGTHIYLGESVLANLPALPTAVADLLRAFPFDFLYGNIAADSSIAKKYAPVGRHCHHWHVGQEIFDRARTDALRAFGLGYLSHLAADVVAHNHFVPRQLAMTSSTSGFGHSYWESRFEVPLGDRFAKTAKEVILLDHGAADSHLDQLIAPTIFSVRTNRRIFRGMVHLTESQGWQRAFEIAERGSRWDLPVESVESHLTLSYDYVMGMLAEPDAEARRFDPAGDEPLRTAKRMRRETLLAGGWRDPSRIEAVAEGRFGLPARTATFAASSTLRKPWRETVFNRRDNPRTDA
ncbi:MAG: zinc dependent phospholipase C family protein [Gemmatimonadota bacterium]|nr:zinc dependent phospholipase C family protein [Gemmatimonadota bacterium]MDH4348121.1 zinc dependent phospholipase C family protein [Gemmatimonadota bacterium]MDH5283099.1 zinc dependent phospholipase C family protein [Gemmatimonadota bacterium]